MLNFKKNRGRLASRHGSPTQSRRRLRAEALESRRLLAVYLVDTVDDTVAADGFVSLREAVQASSTNMAVGDAVAGQSGLDTIRFASSLSGQTFTVGSPLQVSEAVRITGGSSDITLSGGGTSGILTIDDGAGQVLLSDLTLQDGSQGPEAAGGGAILIGSGTAVSIVDVDFMDNEGADGGAVFNDGGRVTMVRVAFVGNSAIGASGSGGAIFNATGGRVIISEGTLSDNSAVRAGGAIEDNSGPGLGLVVRNASFDGNATAASPGNGGAVHMTGPGDSRFDDVLITRNIAAAEGGGLWNGSGTMIVQNATFSGNQALGTAADQGGGGLFNNGGSLFVNDSEVIQNVATASSGAGLMSVGGLLAINGTIIHENFAGGDSMGEGGGGVLATQGRLAITDSSIRDNQAALGSGSGGGVLMRRGTLEISDTEIAGNTAARAGGGIELGRVNATLREVQLGGPDAEDGNDVEAFANPGNGGGLHTTFESVVNIIGGSVENNTAVEGGGIWNSGLGQMTIVGTRIASNTAVRGGGIYDAEAPNDVDVFSADLQTLNAAFGSTARGSARIVVDRSEVTSPTSGTASIRVVMTGSGLQDLTDVPGGIHVAHIHGQFDGNAERPLADQGDGPFFDGEGGEANGFPPSNSVTPSAAEDGDLNVDETSQFGTAEDYVDFFEGRPKYGPVMLNLSANQLPPAPDGVPPLTFFFQQLAAGNIDPAANFPAGTTFDRDTTYTFDLSDADARRQFNNLTSLDTREIVLHGLTIPTNISDQIDANTGAAPGTPTAGVPLGDGTSFRRTAPVAAGEIVAATTGVRLGGVTIVENVATGDAATDGGGGVYSHNELTIGGSVIERNAASGSSGSGGGIFNAGGTLEINDSSLIGNTANRAGGGIEDTASVTNTIRLTNTNLTANIAADSPGNGGGLHVGGSSDTTIVGGTIANNVAGSEGGGVWNGGLGQMTIVGTRIASNTAVRGGGIYDAEAPNDVDVFSADLQTLNAAFGSTARGSARIVVDRSEVTSPTSGTASIRVVMTGSGLQDLTDVPGGIHVAHIHGQFDGNAERPLADQGDGPFFDGEGGEANGFPPSNSVTPSAAEDGDLNVDETSQFGTAEDYVDFFEGRPKYGPVMLNLSANQLPPAPDGVPPLTFFFQQLAAGNIDPAANFPAGTTFDRDTTYTFDLSDADARRQFNNLTSLDTREIVLHGLTIPTNISDQIDANTGAAPGTPTAGVPLGDGTSFRRTAPVAAGEIVAATTGVRLGGVTIVENVATGDAATDGGGGVYSHNELTIGGSVIERNAASGSSGSGGGIFNAGGRLRVNDSTLSDNRSNRAGGGIEDTSGASGGLRVTNTSFLGNSTGTDPGEATPGNGGAVHITGSADSTFSGITAIGNVAAAEGGGLWNGTGTMRVRNSTLQANVASGDDADQGGGGLFNAGGTLLVSRSTLRDNVADGDSGSGGGILNDAGGSLQVVGSTLAGNLSNRAGGGIEDNSGAGGGLVVSGSDFDGNATGEGPGDAAPGNGGAVHITGAGDSSFVNITVSNNLAAAEGGGLWNGGGTMRIINASITGNIASGDAADQGGGGLFNNGGLMIVRDATIRDNVADGSSGSGGGILNVADGRLAVSDSVLSANRSNRAGGGIEDNSGGGGNLSVVNSTLDGNTTGLGPGDAAPGNGGAVHITGPGNSQFVGVTLINNVAAAEGGGLWNGSGTMRVAGSTLGGNVASGDDADQGGGALFNAGGTLIVRGSTLVNNLADGTSGSGGGILSDVGGTLQVFDSTLSGNQSNRAGGGIEDNSGEGGGLLVQRTVFTNNNTGVAPATAAPGNGGAVHITGAGDSAFAAVTLVGNVAAAEGGGLWNGSGTMTIGVSSFIDNAAFGNGDDQGGGGIFNNGGAVTVAGRNVFINNSADPGRGDAVLSDGGIFDSRQTTFVGAGEAIVYLEASGNLSGGSFQGFDDDVVIVANDSDNILDVTAGQSDIDGSVVNFGVVPRNVRIELLDGSDTASVTPQRTVELEILGGDPSDAPGDSLIVRTSTASGTVFTPGPDASSGSYSFDNRADVIFSEFEQSDDEEDGDATMSLLTDADADAAINALFG